jgi:hypothetical protein
MKTETLTGGCLCGGVRFEVAGPLGPASYCHCTRCQRRTGAAASPQVRVEPGSVTVTAGEQLLRAYEPDGGFAKVFCSECGSSLWAARPGKAHPFSIRLGAFDGDPGVRPSYRQHVQSAAPWEPIPEDGLPRFQGSRQ